jgi:hypothetical protein
MKIRDALCAGVLAATVVSGGASASVTYSWDDGAGNVRLGPVFAAEYMWGNVYTARPGGEWITSISVSFGAIPADQALTVYLYQDTTPGDNDPRGSVLLASATGVTPTSPPLNSFWTYSIAPTQVTGDFFVAVSTRVRGRLPNNTTPDTPARLDPQGAPKAAKSWVFAADSFLNPATSLANAPYSLQMSQNAIQGVFMVRANAIPTPAAGALLGLAGLAALRRRRA